MCGCTSTQRTVVGTGICLTCGLSMPTVSTSPPNSDGAMLSTCTEPLATASPCIANFSSCVRSSGSVEQARPPRRRRRPRTPPSRRVRSRAGCPCRSRARSRKPARGPRSSASTAMPAVLRSGRERQIRTTPRDRADRDARLGACGARARDRRAPRPCDRGCRSRRRRCRRWRARTPSRTRVRPWSQLRAQIGADPQQVGEHAGRR